MSKAETPTSVISNLKKAVTEGLKSTVSDEDRWKSVKEAYALAKTLQTLQKNKLLLLSKHDPPPTPPTPATPDDASAKVAFGDFEAWLDDNGVNHDRIRFEYIGKLGCNGVVCTKESKATQEMIRIPSRLIISADNLSATRTGNVWKNIIANDDLLAAMPQLALVIALMSEVYLQEASLYHPYIQVLPRTFPSLPLTWSPEELKCLQGTAVEVESLKRRLNCWAYYCYIYELIRRVQGELKNKKVRPRQWPVFFRKSEYFTFELFLWALCAVTTRQNNLAKSDNDPMMLSLVPVYDMCNHEAGAYSTVYLPTDIGHELVCGAMRDFKEGEEFRIYYGARPNSELLLYSGFVMKPGENSDDFVKVPQELPEDDPLFGIKKLILTNLGYRGTKPVFKIAGPNQAEGLDALTRFTRVRMLVKDDASAVLKAIHEADDTTTVLSTPVNPRNEEATHRYIINLFKELSTSKAEAFSALKSSENKDVSTASKLARSIFECEIALIDMANILVETAAMNLTGKATIDEIIKE